MAPRQLDLVVVAYEFPPSPSPQSLRWAYLANELARLGHRVRVIAPDVVAFGGEPPAIDSRVEVRRVFAGPIMGFWTAWSRALEARRHRRRPAHAAPAAPRSPALDRSRTVRDGHAPTAKARAAAVFGRGLSRTFEAVKAVADRWLYPDRRAEWNPWLRHALRAELARRMPDVLIASHEPASVLEAALAAAVPTLPLVADLGDPVLAQYTPSRWHRRASALEARLAARCDGLVFTTRPAADQLATRHPGGRARRLVVTQGFDAHIAPAGAPAPSDMLELLYTGTLYSFRRVDPLLEAVLATPGVRLSIATTRVPSAVDAAVRSAPDRIRVLGFLPHRQALDLQRGADVLVDLANDYSEQVPGKIYEYLGAGRPVLHIGPPGGAVSRLLESTRRGWTCSAESAEIGALLARLVSAGRQGELDQGLDMGVARVARYSWSSLASTLADFLDGLRDGPAPSTSNQSPRECPHP